MRKLSIVILSAALVAAVAVSLSDAPSVARSAPAPTGTGDKATTRPARSRPSRRPGSRGSGRFGQPLTKEQEQEVLEYLKTKRPELHKQAMSERQRDPRRYRRTIRSMWHFISRMKALPPKLRDAHEVHQATYIRMWQLARELKETKDPSRQKELRKELRDLAERNFDASQIVREHRLSQLSEEIKRLKAELKKRAEDREAVVREMVDRMIRPRRRSPRPDEKPRRPHPASRPVSAPAK
ncbi:MAG TPA: hypothetical protein VM031_03050 [Phycisphaerae bacterium]|nr:hypothetical protein [Phycisphaerae bacterium]